MSESLHQRDDFSLSTKRALADRVGCKCSFPGCSQTTIGPSEESPSSTSNIGMACHIAAASSGAGARRYDASMSREDRRSIENGIWMCYNHGKLIDTDEARFSVEKLKGWKAIAEKKALATVHIGGSTKLPAHVGLVGHAISLTSHELENEIVGNALLDSCMAEVWGDDVTEAVRDTCIEISRNALTHGKATSVTLEIDRHCIRISDDGDSFNPLALNAEEGKGGANTISHLKSSFSHRLLLEYSYSASRNQTTIALVCSAEQICALTPCYVKVNHREISLSGQLPIPSECNEVYLLMPRFTTLSDVYGVKQFLDRTDESRPLVFVVSTISALVLSSIGEVFPKSRTILLDNY